MAVVKTLSFLLRSLKSSTCTLRFHSSTLHPSPFLPSRALSVPPIPLFLPLLPFTRSRLVLPISGWISFSGPLFLVPPAWKLSQSATPLYLRGKEAIIPGDLLGERVLPIGLGGGSVGDFLNGGGWKFCVEAGKDGVGERFLNFPNLISFGRMVSGPVIGWMIMNDWYLYAFGGLAVSGATDWLDGFIARKMNINSVIGSYLDPLADKILIGCVAVAMMKKDLLSPGLVSLVVIRDVALVVGAIFNRASSLGWKWKSWSNFVNLDDTHKERVEPLLISKVNTVLQLLLVAAALLQPKLGTEETELYASYLSWLVASTTTASFAAYIRLYLLRRKLA